MILLARAEGDLYEYVVYVVVLGYIVIAALVNVARQKARARRRTEENLRRGAEGGPVIFTPPRSGPAPAEPEPEPAQPAPSLPEELRRILDELAVEEEPAPPAPPPPPRPRKEVPPPPPPPPSPRIAPEPAAAEPPPQPVVRAVAPPPAERGPILPQEVALRLTEAQRFVLASEILRRPAFRRARGFPRSPSDRGPRRPGRGRP